MQLLNVTLVFLYYDSPGALWKSILCQYREAIMMQIQLKNMFFRFESN